MSTTEYDVASYARGEGLTFGFQSHEHELLTGPVNVTDAELRIELLGGFRVSSRTADVPSTAWRSRNAAQIVKRLALAPDHSMSREQLADLLWPDAGAGSVANSLRQALHIARSQLRTLPLEADLVLQSVSDRVVLYPRGRVWTDVQAFEQAVRLAQNGIDPLLFWAAIERYRGDLLPEDHWAEWTWPHRDELTAVHVKLLDDVARLHQARGEQAQAIVALQRLVRSDPVHESAHVHLMRLYAATGQRPLALRQYHQLVRALDEALDLPPDPATVELYEAIKDDWSAHAPVSQHQEPASKTNLPHPVTSFVGRGRELEQIVEDVARHRLVTLTGPGGIGKTRLALEAAWQLVDAFTGGVWLVELAGLSDSTLVPHAVAAALSITVDSRQPVVRTMLNALKHSRMLLVLDNCEHLIDACADLIGALTRACPGIHVLATSREVLRLDGEHRWPVPALALPRAERETNGAQESEAVQLFADRVRWHQRDFQVNPENAEAVFEICRRLEGIPLALELAAAQCAVLSLPQLVTRLENAVALLAVPSRESETRWRTLRATLDWSYRLLDQSEQRLFRRLSVFADGWTLEAAETICSDRALPRQSILGILGQLCSKSLVQIDVSMDEARHRLLEPVRQYARTLLDESGESASLRERQAAFAVARMESLEPELSGPNQARGIERIAREHDNLRAALRFAIERNDAETALRIEAVLWRFWSIRWHSSEGLAWIEETLSLPSADRNRHRARATMGAGELARRILDFDRATALLEESVEISRELRDDAGTATALAYLANTLLVAERFDESRARARESLSLFRRLDDKPGIARTLNILAEHARLVGDYATAASNYREALELDRIAGDQQSIAIRLHNLGYIALHDERPADAVHSFRAAYDLNRTLGYQSGTLSFLEGMAASASAARLSERAARLYGALEAHWSSPGAEFKLHPPDQAEYDRYTTRASVDLGRVEYQRARMAGTRLSLDEAVAEALAVERELARGAESTTRDDGGANASEMRGA